MPWPRTQPNGLHIRRHPRGQRAEGRGGQQVLAGLPVTQQDTARLQAWGQLPQLYPRREAQLRRF